VLKARLLPLPEGSYLLFVAIAMNNDFCLTRIEKSDVESWNTHQVAAFLWRHNLLSYAATCINEDITGDVLLILTDADLLKISVTNSAHRRRILDTVSTLRTP